MKIALLIESLGSGGAEKLIVDLATGLKERGHNVAVGIYHPKYFFSPILERAGIEIVEFKRNNKLSLVLRVRAWLKSLTPDIVQAYMTNSNAIAVLASIGKRHWKVVVTELSILDHNLKGNIRLKIIRQLYRSADWVLSNSYSNIYFIHQNVAFTKDKSSVIWNGVDLDKFSPSHSKKPRDTFRFLYVASMLQNKNAPRVIAALDLLRKNTQRPFMLRWIGNYNSNNPDISNTMRETLLRVENLGLNGVFTFVGNVEDVSIEMRSADALVLCSLTEGLPNVVCEGMASGLPIVASAVSDIPRMVEDCVNGFLCDPMDISSIVNAMQKCLELKENEWFQFSRTSRRMAEEMFNKKTFIDNYEKLYNYLLNTT